MFAFEDKKLESNKIKEIQEFLIKEYKLEKNTNIIKMLYIMIRIV
jgi:hypothetical protein